MPPGFLPCVTALPKLVLIFGSGGSPLATQGIFALFGEGLSELRIHYGPGYRIYLTKRGDTYVILLAGGDKSSQAQDIRLAKDLAQNL